MALRALQTAKSSWHTKGLTKAGLLFQLRHAGAPWRTLIRRAAVYRLPLIRHMTLRPFRSVCSLLNSVSDSVSSICAKSFTVSQSSTPYGETLEKVVDISMEGFKPLGIVGFTSNHNGSFAFTECCFIDDAHARVAFMNLVPNQGEWGYSEATITVLYIKK